MKCEVINCDEPARTKFVHDGKTLEVCHRCKEELDAWEEEDGKNKTTYNKRC